MVALFVHVLLRYKTKGPLTALCDGTVDKSLYPPLKNGYFCVMFALRLLRTNVALSVHFIEKHNEGPPCCTVYRDRGQILISTSEWWIILYKWYVHITLTSHKCSALLPFLVSCITVVIPALLLSHGPGSYIGWYCMSKK